MPLTQNYHTALLSHPANLRIIFIYINLFYCLFTVAYGKHIFVFGGYNGLERKHHGEVYSLDAGVNSVRQM